MPSAWAAVPAAAGSREAMARTRLTLPFCIAGMTFSRPIFAVLRTPQFTVFPMVSSPF